MMHGLFQSFQNVFKQKEKKREIQKVKKFLFFVFFFLFCFVVFFLKVFSQAATGGRLLVLKF